MSSARLPPAAAGADSCLGAENDFSAVATSSSQGATNVKNVLVVKRTGQEVAWGSKDVWWHEIVDKQSDKHEAEFFDSENGLFQSVQMVMMRLNPLSMVDRITSRMTIR